MPGTGPLLGRDTPVPGDNAWQRKARRLQSEWRERHGLRPGLHRGRPLASRLLLEDGAPPSLSGYMSAAAKRQVLRAVEDAQVTQALLSRPRLWVDLLSSQPLCFNAFGEMEEDHDLALEVIRRVCPQPVSAVHRICFEYSPGRGDDRYTGNRSAFDVFIEASGPRGRGFIGIEVKYHEDLRVKAATDREYGQMASRAGVFVEAALPELLKPPLQQLLLDHLLALRMTAVDPEKWQWGHFMFLHPRENTACSSVAARYSECLSDLDTFSTVTLESFCAALTDAGASATASALGERYLGSETGSHS